MDTAAAVESLWSPEGRADPYPHYATLHEHGPVIDLGNGYVFVVGYQAVTEALRNPALREEGADWVSRSWPDWQQHPAVSLFTDTMLFTGDPAHARVRRLVSRVFTARRITGLTSAIERLTDELLDRLAELGAGGEPVDFMSEFAYTLPVTVIGELLGVPPQDRLWIRPLVLALAAQLEPGQTDEELIAADVAAVELLDYFRSLVAERRGAPKDDLISALVEVQDAEDGRLSERELLVNLALLFFAGFETTTNLLGNGWSKASQGPAPRFPLAGPRSAR